MTSVLTRLPIPVGYVLSTACVTLFSGFSRGSKFPRPLLILSKACHTKLQHSLTWWPMKSLKASLVLPCALRTSRARTPLPRTVQYQRPPPRPLSSSSGSQNAASAGCDKSYRSDLVRVDNLLVINMCNLTFPSIDSSTKNFASLGSSTNTLGNRNLPFCIQVREDSLAGAMESQEVDTDAYSPLQA